MAKVSRRVLDRWQAAGIHLICSALLALAAGLLLFAVWYPQPYTEAAGADRLIMLLIGIDLVLGPLLTLIVYRHGKPGMAFDIGFIASVQLAALVYGLLVIADSRPVFVVMTRDVTYLTMASSLADADLAAAQEPEFQHRSWIGPVLVAAPPPESAEARQEVLESGVAGKDIDRLPKYYRPFAVEGARLISASPPLQWLAERAESAPKVAAFLESTGRPIQGLHFQPLRGRDPEQDVTIVYAEGELAPVGVIAADPWPALVRPRD